MKNDLTISQLAQTLAIITNEYLDNLKNILPREPNVAR